MKKGDIVYHYTKEHASLLRIIEGGFLASYAQEIIYDREVAILMVSFSNSSYFTSVNEFEYSKYAIGLSQYWALENDLQPVAYGHGKGKIQKAIMDIQTLSAVGCIIDSPELKILKGKITSQSQDIDLLNLVEWSKLTSDEIQTIKKVFENIFLYNGEILKYSKPTIVNRKSGKKENSFQDREWRYIPNSEETKMKEIIFKKLANSEVIEKDWKKWFKEDKPHQKKSTLNFNLNDIKYIITEHKNEIESVMMTLFNRFKKENVLKAIENGELLVTSNYHLNSQL